METIAQVAEGMQTVLTQDAQRLGRATGFVQRSGKWGGDGIVQTLVFSFQANPQASYSEMSQAAGALGIEIRPHGHLLRARRQGERAVL